MRHMILSLVFLVACAQSDGNYVEATANVSNAWVQPLTSTIWRIPFNMVNPSVPGNSTCFGRPLNQLIHSAEDWANAAGTPVRAIGAGTVVYAAYANYPGSVIVIRHTLNTSERAALGVASSTIYSMYGHLTGLLVQVGAQVVAGQQIASILDQASNSHLHWEVRTVEVPQLCGLTPPGPGYTNAGTDARTWGYMSPSGSLAALAGAAPPTTCDNNVPVGGTACNPSDPAAQFVCTSPGLPSSQQWTRQLCPSGQSCSGTHCQGGVPACGSGLFCAGGPIPGASQCMSGTQAIYCCPSGQTIVNGACSSPNPPPCGSGLFCSAGPIAGSSQCLSGTQPVYCCAPGHTIVNGACSP